MNAIAVELDQKLQSLDRATAASVEQRVREALQLVEQNKIGIQTWPVGFWDQIRADWGSEPFERPPQGDFEKREDW